MRVNSEPAVVRGFRFSGVSAGLKKAAGAKDLGLIVADAPAAAAAVFSANRVKAAPVYVTADRVKSGRLQAVVANSGCANSSGSRTSPRASASKTTFWSAAAAVMSPTRQSRTRRSAISCVRRMLLPAS